MSQTRIDSILEVITNVTIGIVVAFTAQTFWFPIIGKEFTATENLYTVLFFTVISLFRSYGIRRLFDGKPVYQTSKRKLDKLRKRAKIAFLESYKR